MVRVGHVSRDYITGILVHISLQIALYSTETAVCASPSSKTTVRNGTRRFLVSHM